MRRGRRGALQLALLPVLWVIAQMTGTDGFTVVVATFLVMGFPLSGVVALVLVLMAREIPDSASLADTADNAVSMFFGMTAVTAVAIVALLRVANIIVAPIAPVTLVLLGWALVVFVFPSLTWARALRQVWIPMLRRRVATGELGGPDRRVADRRRVDRDPGDRDPADDVIDRHTGKVVTDPTDPEH